MKIGQDERVGESGMKHGKKQRLHHQHHTPGFASQRPDLSRQDLAADPQRYTSLYARHHDLDASSVNDEDCRDSEDDEGYTYWMILKVAVC